MWKKALLRGGFSFCVCVAVNNLIALILGLCGHTQSVTPEFAARIGSLMTATFLQPLLIGLIGFAFGAGSVLFFIEKWSFLRQGAAHFLLTAAVWIAVEWICFSPITPPTVVAFALSAAGTYAITWSVQYFVWKKRVRALNEQIRRMNREEDG